MTPTITPLTLRGLIAPIAGHDHLVGAACTGCATHTFPFQAGCPRCGGATEHAALPRVGTLWSWTVQRIRPKPPYDGPEEFEAYAVGYVDLGPLKVEGRLEGRDPTSWTIGTPVRLQPGPADADGNVWRYRWLAVTSPEDSSPEVTS